MTFDCCKAELCPFGGVDSIRLTAARAVQEFSSDLLGFSADAKLASLYIPIFALSFKHDYTL